MPLSKEERHRLAVRVRLGGASGIRWETFRTNGNGRAGYFLYVFDVYVDALLLNSHGAWAWADGSVYNAYRQLGEIEAILAYLERD